MVIKVLGTGCAKCHQLEENTRKAVAELGIDAAVEKVENIKDIMKYGVMRTPALVINEKVISSGRVLTVNEIINILKSC